MWTPCSASARNEFSPLISSAPSTAPERLETPPTTSIASVVKVSSTETWLGRDRAELVHEQAAGEAGERAADHERVEPLAVDVDARRLRRLRVLARRPQLAPEAASLVGEGDDDRDQRARHQRPDPARRHQRERRDAGADLVPVADDVGRDAEHRERRDAGRAGRRAASAGSPATSANTRAGGRGERERRRRRGVRVAQERRTSSAGRGSSARRRA